MQKLVLNVVVCAIAICGIAQPAQAIKQFSDQFMKLYKVDKNHEEKTDLEKAVLEAKCFTCHQGRKSKKNRNAYGAQLSKLLDKKKDKKKPKKIVEALEKVAKMHTVPKDEKSPTFGDLIKAGKLPGGPLEELKKEPKGSDTKGSIKQG